MLPPPFFIINPAAGRGRAARRWERVLRPTLLGAFPGMRYTVAEPGQCLGELARRAITDGNTLLAGVGGDGTHHSIINGVFSGGFADRVVYVPLPLGSGNDWVRTLGVPHRLGDWIDLVRRGATIDHRVGLISIDRGGEVTRRYFLNVLGFAYDAYVVNRVERGRFKHRLLYPLHTLRHLRSFRPARLRLTYDGAVLEERFHTVNLGLGRYSGGGMRLVPQADPTADRFALTFAEQMSVPSILRYSWRFYTPHIGRVPGVTVTYTRQLRLEPLDGELEGEADGEYLGRGTFSVVIAGNVRIVSPRGK